MIADVSAIIPCFNSSRTVGRCLQSILDQTLKINEVVVIDDGSEDSAELAKVINDYSSFMNIKFIRFPSNLGVSAARNSGVINACSKYISFLDSDDVWFDNKIEVQYNFMLSSKARISGHRYVFDTTKTFINSADLSGFHSIGLYRFVLGNQLFTPSVMALREGFVLFDTRFKRMEDYKCWVENYSNNEYFILDAFLAGGFKRPIGFSGLSGSISLMHSDYLAVLECLFSEKKIKTRFYIMARIFEFIKFPLRVIFHAINNLVRG